MTQSRKAYSLFVGFFCLLLQMLSAQDQKLADSLARIYQTQELPDTAKLELLRNLAYNEIRDLDLGIRYADELISLIFGMKIFVCSQMIHILIPDQDKHLVFIW